MASFSANAGAALTSSILLVMMSAMGVSGHDHDMGGIEEGQHISAEPIVRT